MKLFKKPSGYWYYRLKGDRVALSLRTKDKAEALKMVEDLGLKAAEAARRRSRTAASALIRVSGAKRQSPAQWIDEWLEQLRQAGRASNTLKNYRTEMLASGLPFPNVTSHDIGEYVNRGDAKLGTRKVRLSVVKSLCKYLTATGAILHDPCALVEVRLDELSHSQKEPSVKEPLTDQECARLEGLPEPYKTASLLSLSTGLRLTDVAYMRSEQVHADTIVVWTDKHDHRLVVKRVPGIRTDHEFVFPELATLSRSTLSDQFRRAFRSVGINKSFHCLRHTYASRLARSGVPAEHIQKLMGHEDKETTATYIHDLPPVQGGEDSCVRACTDMSSM